MTKKEAIYFLVGALSAAAGSIAPYLEKGSNPTTLGVVFIFIASLAAGVTALKALSEEPLNR